MKYHLGATGEYSRAAAARSTSTWSRTPATSKPSIPVTIGRTRAKQDRAGEGGREKYLPLLVHGDAAFAGQGITAETMNFADLPGYTVGGTIHIIVNNLVGFTTNYREEHSERFSADLARRQSIPIFHVNAEDVDAVVRVGRMALEYRYTFGTDVVIDMIGYRRHGHSEVDDPTVTQPLLYKAIKAHPPLWEIYAEDAGIDAEAEVAEVKTEYEAGQKNAGHITKKPTMRDLPGYWDNYFGGRYKAEYEKETGLSAEELTELTEKLTTYPAGFHIHPKVKKLLEQRAEMGAGQARCRLRHGRSPGLRKPGESWHSHPHERTGLAPRHLQPAPLRPARHRRRDASTCRCATSPPGRHAATSTTQRFPKPESWASNTATAATIPKRLVLWEAQFGDFANVAQAVIDQFVSAGEDKWGLLSGLVLLLPHGYEGQGPEHSSARIERFLQLAARDNFQICQPSNAAQYFHLLRRQALRHWRKPLVVFTPKSMLRHPDACSPIEDFTHQRFLPVVPDTGAENAKRILVCTGKIGHELRVERQRRKDTSNAIIFIDQLYPLHETELKAAIDRHPEAREIVWVQEEPANMGALFYMMPRLRHVAGDRAVLSVKRSPSPSPSTGSARRARNGAENADLASAHGREVVGTAVGCPC